MAIAFEQGRYWGKITHQRLGETSKGNPQLILSFQVVGKIDPSDPEGALQRCPEYERSIFRTITDKTLDYVIQDMDALGWFGNKWSQFDEGDRECVDIRGKELAFSCKHEPKQVLDEATGKYVNTSEMRETWSIAQTGSGPPVKPLDKGAMSKLDAMFGKALKGRKPANGEKQQQPERKPVGELTKEEVNAELGEVPSSEVPF